MSIWRGFLGIILLCVAGLVPASLFADYTYDTTNGDIIVNATLTGPDSLYKNGNGTLTLNGDNSYGGGTTLNLGTLAVGSDTALGTGTLSLNGGTLIASGGDHVLSNPLVLAAQSTITIGGSQNLTLAGSVSLTGPSSFSDTLNITNPAGTTFSGVISGAGSLTKSGSGALTIAGLNTYTGNFTLNGGNVTVAPGAMLLDSSGSLAVNSGTLTLANAAQTVGSLSGGGTVILGNGSTLTVNNSSSIFTGVLAGAGALVKGGAGTLTLSGPNTYTGGTTIATGTLEIGSGISGGATGAVAGSISVAPGAWVVFNRSNNSSLAGDISGGGAVIKRGIGTLSLTGNDTVTGSTSISSGTLQIGSGGTLGSISGNVFIGVGGTLAFNRSDDLVSSSVIIGPGALVKNGAGTLSLTGNDSFSGSATVNTGTLQIGNGGTWGSVTSGLKVGSGAALAFNRSDNVTFANSISGAGSVVQQGAGMLTLPMAQQSALTYTGSTEVLGGILAIPLNPGGGIILPPTGNLLLNGGILATNNALNLTIGTGSNQVQFGTAGGGFAATDNLSPFGLSGRGVTPLSVSIAGTPIWGSTPGFLPDGATLFLSSALSAATLTWSSPFSLGSGARTINVADNPNSIADAAVISGVISGSGGSLIKAGNGTLTLTRTNTYTGNTTISGGVLALSSGGTISNGNLKLDGGVLATNGIIGRTIGTGSGQVQFGAAGGGFAAAGSALSVGFTGNEVWGSTPGFLPDGAVLTLSGVTWTSNFSLGTTDRTIQASTATASGIISGTGGLILTGTGNLTFNANNTYSGNTTVQGGTLVLGANVVLPAGNLMLDGGILEIKGTFNRTLGSGPNQVHFGAGGGGFTANGSALNVGFTGNEIWGVTPGFIPDGGVLYLNAGRDATAAVTWTSNLSLGASTRTIYAGSSYQAVIAGVISGNGGLSITGGGILALAGNNTFAGGLVINNSELGFNNLSNFGTGAVTLNGSTLLWPSRSAIDVSSRLAPLNGTNVGFDLNRNAVSFANGLSGTGYLEITNGSLTFAGTNTFAGILFVNGITVTVAPGGQLMGNSGDLEIGALGTVNLNNSAQTIGALQSFSGGTLNLAVGHTLTLDIPAGEEINFMSGIIAGAGSLVKAGAGIQTLSSSSTFTGTTTINGGTLNVTGSIATSSLTTVNVGGALTGTGTVGALLVNGGTVSPGDGIYAGLSPTVIHAGSTTLSSGTLLIQINSANGTAGTNWDLLASAGKLTVSALAGQPFTVAPVSLNNINNPNSPGALTDFDPTQSYSWEFARSTGGINFVTGASLSNSFAVDTSGFANAYTGVWTVSESGVSLYLDYGPAAVPEPATFTLALAALLGGWTVIRSRSQKAPYPSDLGERQDQ